MKTNILLELHTQYGNSPSWQVQLRLLSQNPILYTEDYEMIPDEVYRWKSDEELMPLFKNKELLLFFQSNNQIEKASSDSPYYLWVGIGKYPTIKDRELYMCTLLNQATRQVEAYSFGVYRSPELVRKALDIFFEIYDYTGRKNITLLSSRNPIYKTKQYAAILSKYPVTPTKTPSGTRGGAAIVSIYFSQLMRRKGTTTFETWQDALDWLTMDIIRYNLKIST